MPIYDPGKSISMLVVGEGLVPSRALHCEKRATTRDRPYGLNSIGKKSASPGS